MADIIRLTAQEVEALAQKFSDASTETEELLNRLGNEVSSAASGWEGDAYNAFVNKYEEIRTQMKSVVEMYENINELLRNVVSTMQETDSQIASSMG